MTSQRRWAVFPDHRLCDRPTTLWFDPGGTTGWSRMSCDIEALTDSDTSILATLQWEHGEIRCLEDEEAGLDQMLAVAAEVPGTCIGIEDFIPYKFSKQWDFYSPMRLTAAAKWIFREHLGMQPVHIPKQSADDAKKEITNDRLKRWGLYERKGGLEHARDADRHAILWLRKCKGMDKTSRARRQEAWPFLYR